jgi:lactate dehydrogenase-like 2-hydroxyacid dehydrogenase
VEPRALREALVAGQISAAALDGYYLEPTPLPEDDPHGLIGLHPRLLVTPHCASFTDEALQQMADMAAANLLAVLAGDVPPHPIPVDQRCAEGNPVERVAR